MKLPLNSQWLEHHLAKGKYPQLLWQSQSNHTLMKNRPHAADVLFKFKLEYVLQKVNRFWGLLKSGHNKRRFWSFWRGLTKLKIYIQGGLSDLGGGDKNATVVKSKLRHLLCNTSGLCYSEMYSFIWTLSYNITLIAHRRAWTSLIAIFLLAYRLASGGAGYIKVEEGRLEKEWRGWNKVGKVETTWTEGMDRRKVTAKNRMGRPGIDFTPLFFSFHSVFWHCCSFFLFMLFITFPPLFHHHFYMCYIHSEDRG